MKLKAKLPEQFLSEIVTPSWIIEGIIPERSLTMVSGLPGAGKTFFALEAAIAVCTGTSFMGQFPTNQLRVLFIEEDNPDWDLAAQFRKVLLGRGMHPWHVKNDFLFLVKQGAHLNDDAGASAIAELIEYCKSPEQPSMLVVIDNLRDIHDLDEDKSYLMKQITRRLDYIRNRTGAALLVLHHPRKGSKGADPLSDLRGSGGLGGKVDGILGVRYVPRTDTHQVIVGKRRAMLMKDWNYRVVETEDSYAFDCTIQLNEIERLVLDSIGDETQAKQVVEAVVAAMPELGYPEKRVHDAVARLRSMGHLVRVRRGVYSRIDNSEVDSTPDIDYASSRKEQSECPDAATSA